MRVCHCTLGKDGRCCQDKQGVLDMYPEWQPKPITPSPPRPGIYPRSCPRCFNTVLPMGANYCPNCGTFVGVLGSPT